MEVVLHDHGVYKSSQVEEGNKISESKKNGEKKVDDDVLVEIDDRSRTGESSKLCRICHFGDDDDDDDSQLISLGCDCRGELGFSHRNCAAVWFSQKGNRVCEICGKMAKNIDNDNNNNNDRGEGDGERLRMEMNEMRLVIEALDNTSESNRRCKMSFCNFLLGCLLLAFVLPWFFRGIDVL